ncbi:MAG: hybrid sensor histidine kinase/response regulator [Chloroflexi bacterium]|nr:hybrid sensor histidine kinase/response regulator [Chloroflexota bacterium]
MNDQTTDTSKATILIVDDTPHVQRLLSAMLLKQGYEVQTADSGMEALEAVRTTPPNLILLDIMMPQMDGYQVCQQLKADEQTRDIPIIFVSALEEVENKVRALTIGGVDYITKPFQAKEVLARVATHLTLRALQEQLEEASGELAAQLEELQARNEELDALARTMGHDLKTPLTSIIGFADMLKSLHATLPGESLEESLDAIASNGRKMDKIIDDLLLLAGLRQVEKVDIRPLDMAIVVKTAVNRLKDHIKEYQAGIILPDEWPMALGHGPWVEEVWANYISSAIESGGRPPRVELGATPAEDGTIQFWVRDNSPGTASNEQAQSRSSSGQRGLGMMVARRIMEKLGRKASVESTEDAGNIYSFTLRAV